MIRMLGENIAVRRFKEDENSKGGIFIPDNAKEKSLIGTVVAVGSGEHMKDGSVRPLDVKVGDKVYVSKYYGDETEVTGEPLLITRESDILCVIES